MLAFSSVELERDQDAIAIRISSLYLPYGNMQAKKETNTKKKNMMMKKKKKYRIIICVWMAVDKTPTEQYYFNDIFRFHWHLLLINYQTLTRWSEYASIMKFLVSHLSTHLFGFCCCCCCSSAYPLLSMEWAILIKLIPCVRCLVH